MLEVSTLAGAIYSCVTAENPRSWLPKETLFTDVLEHLNRRGWSYRADDLTPRFNEAFRLAFRQFVNCGPLSEITQPVTPPTLIKVNRGI